MESIEISSGSLKTYVPGHGKIEKKWMTPRTHMTSQDVIATWVDVHSTELKKS